MSQEPSATERLTMLWVKAQPAVWGYIRCTVTDYHHAEDVLQAVAQQTAVSFADYDASRPFTAWAIGIARNKVREHLRRHSRDRLVFSDRAIEMIGDGFTEEAGRLTALRRLLVWCLGQLTDRARELLKLRYASRLKPGEIATRQGMSANAVRIRLHRYRTALAECVQQRLAMEERE